MPRATDLDTEYSMPEASAIIYEGDLGRQTLSPNGVSWPSRKVALTDSAIYMGKPGKTLAHCVLEHCETSNGCNKPSTLNPQP